MGPKKSDSISKGTKTSLGGTISSNVTGSGTTGEQEYQQCTGKFAADLELCCREPPPIYPVIIPVYVRGRLSSIQTQTLAPQSQQQPRSRPHSRASATPSVIGGLIEEQSSTTTGKKPPRSRKLSTAQSGIIIGVTGTDNDTQSLSNTGQEPSKPSSSPYRTFHLLNNGDFFRPKLLVDLLNNESESIDQITALYMTDWQLDQRFSDILKRALPLQEQLHTLNFCFVGLREETINGLVELCQAMKNLKSLSLDGNPLAAEYFYRLIEKDDSKITHLSLRFCEITDTGVQRLANALGNISTQNWKLLTLNLSGNRISDDGATFLATALRYNRTLISLNLSSNFITDKGTISLALVLRRIVLTREEIIRRRYLLAERYAQTHPEEFRQNTSSPTPSNVSIKSKSGRGDWKRATDPNKRKLNSSKIAQIVVDKRNRNDSDDSRPSSRNKSASKQGRNEGGSGRSSALNLPSAIGTASRRIPANISNSNSKDSDQSRTSSSVRAKKLATAVSAAAKKNISIVKEEDENASAELISLQIQQAGRENPLIETNEAETRSGEIWLRGNLALLNLNLSRNYLTVATVKEFLLSVQQQSALTRFNDAANSTSSTMSSLLDFSGLCRLELKGMDDISSKSVEYQSLETLLTQKNPLIRFQQFKDRELKELLELQSIPVPQQLQPTLADKTTNTSDKTRAGSSMKTAAQRPTSRLKE